MKLVRLTSEDPNGIFKCDFNDGFAITPETKIALHSCSVGLDSGAIIIDNENNGIDYSVKAGFLTKILLDPFQYNKANINLLLENIQDKFNKAVKFESGNKHVLGLEWNVGIDTANKTNIQYQIGQAGEYKEVWSVNNVFRGTAGGGTWGITGGQPSSTAANNVAFSNNAFISRGNGYIRARINELTDTGATNTNGMTVGLSNNPQQPANFTDADRTHAIKVTIDNATGNLQYFHILNGVETLSGVTPNPVNPNDSNNDVLEVTINDGKIQLNRYEAGNQTPTQLAEHTYDQITQLYPFLSFNGERTKANFRGVSFTPSPFQLPRILSLLGTPGHEHDSELGAPPRQDPNQNPTTNFIEFESDELAAFLGYERRSVPANKALVAYEANFVGTNNFSAVDVEGFLIQALNLDLESYDALEKSRKNILAIIPDTDDNGNVVDIPNYPVFLELSNKESKEIRNLNFRVVRSDYSQINQIGLGVINILFEN